MLGSHPIAGCVPNQVMQTDVGYASTADHPNRYGGL
jgi:hypothetical protein